MKENKHVSEYPSVYCTSLCRCLPVFFQRMPNILYMHMYWAIFKSSTYEFTLFCLKLFFFAVLSHHVTYVPQMFVCIMYFSCVWTSPTFVKATHWDQIQPGMSNTTTESHARSKACWDGASHTVRSSVSAVWASDLSGAVSCNCCKSYLVVWSTPRGILMQPYCNMFLWDFPKFSGVHINRSVSSCGKLLVYEINILKILDFLRVPLKDPVRNWHYPQLLDF